MENPIAFLHPGPDEKKSSFRHWIVAFIVCNFNVDLGPEIELVYPPNTPFSQSDLSAICFNSFPERHDADVTEDLGFQFTIRNNSPNVRLESPNAPYGSATLLHGNCIFRQEFDTTIKRSFNQRTMCIISNQPFPALFMHVLQRMTSETDFSNPNVLEQAFLHIASWPTPSVGSHSLPFMGSVLPFEIAPHAAFPLQGLRSAQLLSSSSAFMESQRLIHAYEPVGDWEKLLPHFPSISELFVLFERLILCESIIVFSRSPQLCSEMVSALVDLVKPIPYAAICRPYMTMQSEFSGTGASRGLPRQFLIGITNPFMLQRILGLAEELNITRPHVISLGPSDKSVRIKSQNSQKRKDHHTMDFPSGMDAQNTSKRYIKTDREFAGTVESLLRGTLSSSHSSANEDVGSFVRRYFGQLTAQFLAPFNRYFASTAQAASTTDTAFPSTTRPDAPQYASFSLTAFLASLGKHGTGVTFRGQAPLQRHRARDAMYTAFCSSPNFYAWLEMKLGLEKEATAGLLGSGE
ncbi:hypothetical protein P152DRAFT_112460 [Eremomyces bilateralis CBS 781.70]|uniref:UDENN domain-containing protein n=1 Tax=Eremomyces bilateralis CBS 781.70 TaxID=1392243 RepID=A0A6G1GE67_9PEZI|nr:uncharacterized protein P152DRAFT_112460 [Eremomyces bilateralis CBS 781.70]KAF1816159.1 hypothetical protein P152DRAFT_112460 [Eremomyces bilateralis CBS 781.70]